MILSVKVLNSILTLNSMIESSLWSCLSINTWQYQKFKLCSICITLSMHYLHRVEIQLTTCHHLYNCMLIVVLYFVLQIKDERGRINFPFYKLYMICIRILLCVWASINESIYYSGRLGLVFKTLPSALGLEGDKAKQHKQKV